MITQYPKGGQIGGLPFAGLPVLVFMRGILKACSKRTPRAVMLYYRSLWML